MTEKRIIVTPAAEFFRGGRYRRQERKVEQKQVYVAKRGSGVL